MYMFPLVPEKIAELIAAPPGNVAINWPKISGALNARGIFSERVALAALATLRVETPLFLPQHEWGDDAYFTRMYDPLGEHPHLARVLGNTEPGDGVKFCGRGFIQLTGRHNYAHYGQAVDVDLIAHPELAMSSGIAAELFAQYFLEKKVAAAAEDQKWNECRRLINGGYNGIDDFRATIVALQVALQPPAVAKGA